MNNTNYVFTFNAIKLSVQILQLKDSYYIYIGSNDLTFNNLTLSLPFTECIKSNPTTQIIDEEPNAIARVLSSSLSSKLNKPIYLSYNLNPEGTMSTNGLCSFLEKQLTHILTS